MSSPTRAIKAPAPRRLQGQVHLPSVHIRARNGTGFDYDEDICVRGGGRNRIAERTVTLAAVRDGAIEFTRETTDILSDDEFLELEANIGFFMNEHDPEVIELMEARGRREYARQMRIVAGTEIACANCGCSDSRACSGGCVWATKALCSRCL